MPVASCTPVVESAPVCATPLPDQARPGRIRRQALQGGRRVGEPREVIAGRGTDLGEEAAEEDLAIGLHRQGKDEAVGIGIKAVQRRLGVSGEGQQEK